MSEEDIKDIPSFKEQGERYAKSHPDELYTCPENHRFAVDRACCACSHPIWTDMIKCPHCGAENECEECNPMDWTYDLANAVIDRWRRSHEPAREVDTKTD